MLAPSDFKHSGCKRFNYWAWIKFLYLRDKDKQKKFGVVLDQSLALVTPTSAPEYKVNNAWNYGGWMYLFIPLHYRHACCVCMCVKRQTHLQLLLSSWLVLLHQKWKLVPSLKQERKYIERFDLHLSMEWECCQKRTTSNQHTLATDVWLTSCFSFGLSTSCFNFSISKTFAWYKLFIAASSATCGSEWHSTQHCKEYCQFMCPFGKFYNH